MPAGSVQVRPGDRIRKAGEDEMGQKGGAFTEKVYLFILIILAVLAICVLLNSGARPPAASTTGAAQRLLIIF